MNQFLKILKFELKGYLKNKVFVGITIFLVAAITVVMFIPNILSLLDSFGDSDSGYTDIGVEEYPSSSETDSSVEIVDPTLPVMLLHSEDRTLAENIKDYFGMAFWNYDIRVSEGDVEEVKSAVVSGEAECAFVFNGESSYTYYVDNLSMYDMNMQTADEVLQEYYRINAMVQNGISPEQAEMILSVFIESNFEALGKNQVQNFFYTYIMIFSLYMVILLYGQMVATNVATEKSSRAMEVLITSAKPASMMFGKVLASCIAGFSQLVLVFGTAILMYNVNKETLSNPMISSIFDIPVELFIYLIVFFILGFLIYAFMFGAIGSTASRLEDINTSVMPITFLFIIAFMVVMFSMSSGMIDNTVMKVCSYIPFTSPMAMFTRICMSSVPWYEILISVIILIASTVGIGILSAKIYRVGVLLYGTPPKIGTLLKTVFKKQ